VKKPHSEDEFGEQRDFWWHADFLDLMARRWRLGEASSLADIGCGLCHWSRLLYRYLRKPARFAGIDREARWVRDGAENFRQAFPEIASDLLTFKVGDATKIPLPDNSFEVVTCQTVLMHLQYPELALREMLRILRPGGMLVCVEPNNLWNYIAFTSLTANEPVEAITRRFEFWLRYHRGKKAEGKGDHCIGDLLPGHFQSAGLTEIAVYQSDRAASIFPPYDTPAQRAVIEQEKVSRNSRQGPWDAEEAKRQVLLGGGTPEFFQQAYPEVIEKFDSEQRALREGKFHAAFGSLFYLVSGRKRPAD
jgi:ubiquinone/menaquinone biosynthesis C-methylase UbiE